MICKRILCLVVSIVMAVVPVLKAQENPEKTPLPCQIVGDIDRINFNEPSGIVFHPKRGSLFVVGDEGDLCEIRPDGTPIVKSKRIRNADFEGITCDPSTGLLYVAVERERKILELNPGRFLHLSKN